MSIDPNKYKFDFQRFGPKKVERERTVYSVEHNQESGTKRLVAKKKKETVEVWDVVFPHGHSVRLTKNELVRMGYDRPPRIVDILTGDVISGGATLSGQGE